MRKVPTDRLGVARRAGAASKVALPVEVAGIAAVATLRGLALAGAATGRVPRTVLPMLLRPPHGPVTIVAGRLAGEEGPFHPPPGDAVRAAVPAMGVHNPPNPSATAELARPRLVGIVAGGPLAFGL